MTALQQISADNFRRMMESTDWPNVETDMSAWWDWAKAGLPAGVHILSPESQATLARVAEKCAARAARHIKRGS